MCLHAYHQHLDYWLNTADGRLHTHLQLSSQLTNWRERCYTLRADNTQLMSSLTSAQKNCHHSQDEVLALRGRLTSTRKACEQLQMKCTSLEHTVETLARRSPTVVRVPSRSREEVRLTEECKRKVGMRCCTLVCCTYMYSQHCAVGLLLFYYNKHLQFIFLSYCRLSPSPYHCRMTFLPVA